MAAQFSKLSIATPTVLVLALLETAHAQIATDGTVGPRMELNGPEFDIRADLGRQAGRNLFHSFDRFSLATGERATFSGPDQIRNVISRVTGGARSEIDGTLRSTIPGADFYFINPAGILFGPNASLDLQGSFHVSTADEVRFRDGAKFSTDLNAGSSFTVATPEAFGFLGAGPAPITADASFLRVPPGAALSIVGGGIDIAGGVIRAEAGQITLAAASGPGEVRLGSGTIDAVQRADVSLDRRARVNASGAGGGTVRIRGGRVVVEGNSSVSADNRGPTDATIGIDVGAETVKIVESSRLSANAFGSGAGGDVSINANDVRIKGGVISSDVQGTGAGGDVSITARHIEIGGGSSISTNVLHTAANGGTIRIQAEKAEIDGKGEGLTEISSNAIDGEGGHIIIIAEHLILRNLLLNNRSSGKGQGGAIIITANDLEIVHTIITSGTSNSGDGGPITLTAIDMHLENSFIGSDTFASTGDAGNITITTSGLIIDGSNIDSGTTGSGSAGQILVRADKIDMRDFSRISSSWELIFPVFEDPDLTKAVPITIADVAMRIGIDLETVQILFGPAGDFFLSQDGRIFVIDTFNGEDVILFLPPGAGIAGDVFLAADEITIDNGVVATDSFASAGGRITIEAKNLIDLVDADVSSNGLLPEEGDSVITLRAPQIAINASRVTSLTSTGEPLLGSGEARILGDATAISADSEVAASSRVEISGQETDLGSQLVAFESTVVDAAPLRERCSVRRDIGASSLTNVGRGGLPASPDAPLRSAYRGASPQASANAASESAASGVGAQGWMIHLTGCSGAP